MSLALSTLLYEWRRYMAAVVALAFSGLLVLAQVGMFMGMFFTGSCKHSDGVDGHVRIGNVWYEVDGHGRVIFRAPDEQV
jgi:hypothetical protein